ncbi:MAG: transcription-repair coupling factor [Myxococcota bacterium]
MHQAPQGSLRELAGKAMQRDGPLRITGLRGAARALVGAELVRAHRDRPVLILSADSRASDLFLADLCTSLGGEERPRRVFSFPRHDTLPYDRFSPQPFLVVQRMGVLYRWLSAQSASREGEPGPVVVAPWTALARRVPSRRLLASRCSELRVGQSLDRDEFVASLIGAGYARMPLVEERGEVAVRGGIVDLFPPQVPRPLRVEFLADEVESIREFDPASQRSQHERERLVAPPPRELLFDRPQIVTGAEKIRALAAEQQVPSAQVEELVGSLLRGHVPPGAEALAPLIQPDQASVLEFLPDDTLVVLDDPKAGRERLERYWEEARANFTAAREAGRLAVPARDLLIETEDFTREIEARRPISLERLELLDDTSATPSLRVQVTTHDELRRALARSRTHDRALEPLVDELALWIADGWRSVLTCNALSGAERLRTLLGDYGIETTLADDSRPAWRWSRAGRVEVRVAPLSEGFAMPNEGIAVVTEEEIFGPREKRRRRAGWPEGVAVEGLGQLRVGDHLVHADHGIGTYRGLVELQVGPAASELLCIEYAGNDRLFLPVHRLNLVQRYGGADGQQPRLDRLGGQTWERAKRKVRKSLRNMAEELLAVHATRELTPGFAYSGRDRYFEEFEAGFPFEETPDQVDAIEDVLADLQRPKPMDRLVCGDVGYGKTEVAIRAAFRVAMDGKQTAVLVPTTVLCLQHEETFRKRFEGYPIEVNSLSRFKSARESRKVLEGLASGSIDIVIGTHRLLQKNVHFRDLGLLVIDEEHRFGVTHKERIKKVKQSVDVITLTATPIPRTLQLSFTGIRDLSIINTAPADRLAVRTQLCRFSQSLIREAILREMQRGGQVFFVHNRVRTIGPIGELLARIVPEARVLVAHGQMKERELEDRMLAFLRGEADVLLCTTIIESGLDIPRANTILINRAHTLGLAQLYQLRGRVGRSHHRAYAYLLVPGPDALNAEAERRLEAIQDLSELGSGFRLANMDLEIRGAGNLLGREQSGNLAAVGYDTYMEMLAECIEELRSGPREVEIDPEIRLPVAARLPEDYVADVSQRLVLYKRLAGCRDRDELARVRDELLDRYGALPPEAQNLLEVIRIKLLARQLGVRAVEVVSQELVLCVAERNRLDPRRLLELAAGHSTALRVSPDHKIFAPAPTAEEGAAALLDAASALLEELGAPAG